MAPRYHAIAMRLINGQTFKQIARGMNVSPSFVSRVSKDPRFLVELRRLQKKAQDNLYSVQETIKELAPVALETIENTMLNSRSEKLKFEAAKDLMDRAGYVPVTKNLNLNATHQVTTETMTNEELRALVLKRLQRMESTVDDKQREQADAISMDVKFEEV